MHGFGTFTWPDGRKYTGQFVDNYREGEGTYTWPDSSNYSGGWLRGKYHGSGTFSQASGKTVKA